MQSFPQSFADVKKCFTTLKRGKNQAAGVPKNLKSGHKHFSFTGHQSENICNDHFDCLEKKMEDSQIELCSHWASPKYIIWIVFEEVIRFIPSIEAIFQLIGQTTQKRVNKVIYALLRSSKKLNVRAFL